MLLSGSLVLMAGENGFEMPTWNISITDWPEVWFVCPAMNSVFLSQTLTLFLAASHQQDQAFQVWGKKVIDHPRTRSIVERNIGLFFFEIRFYAYAHRPIATSSKWRSGGTHSSQGACSLSLMQERNR